MQLAYRFLADLIVIVHAAYVVWVVVGLLLVWIGWWRSWNWVRGFWMRTTHLGMILVVVAESWWGITCPLTTWERYFRDLSGGHTYRGDFLAHVVHGLLFYDAPPWAFTLAYTVFGAAVVASFLAVPPRRKPPHT